MKHLVVLVLIILVAASALSAQEFPELQNWKPQSEVDTYYPENLWEYINGAAEQFLAYGFQQLDSREVARDSVSVIIDIYNMGSRLNALGIYFTEKPDDVDSLPIGVETVVLPPYQALLLKGIYYVKVDIFEGELSEEVARPLLESIAEALPGEKTLPGEFELLPKKGIVDGSAMFRKKAFLGLSDLRNCVYASYEDDSKSLFTGFIILPEGDETVEGLWNNLAQKWQTVEFNGQRILLKKIPYKGVVGITLKENQIIGIAGSKDTPEFWKRIEFLFSD